MNTLIVFFGAGLGGALRYGVSVLVSRVMGADFPYHTLIINILGSLAMGVIAESFALRVDLPLGWRLFLTTGILGGFTTFSAFSLDAASLYERGQIGAAAAYVAGSVVLSIGALFAGLAATRAILS